MTELAKILSNDSEHPTAAQVVIELLGLRSRQQLSRLVASARRQGEPICSNKNGYYLAQTRQEMENFCGRLMHRAKSIFVTRQACLKTAKGLPVGKEKENV